LGVAAGNCVGLDKRVDLGVAVSVTVGEAVPTRELVGSVGTISQTQAARQADKVNKNVIFLFI
jgi:hypothetical protein